MSTEEWFSATVRFYSIAMPIFGEAELETDGQADRDAAFYFLLPQSIDDNWK